MRLNVITACSFHRDLPNMVFLYFGISVFLVVLYGGVGGVGDPLTFNRNAADESAGSNPKDYALVLQNLSLLDVLAFQEYFIFYLPSRLPACICEPVG